MLPKNIRCISCGAPAKFTRGPKLFLKKFIVQKVSYYKCAKCGKEFVPSAEYEKVRRKLMEEKKELKRTNSKYVSEKAALSKYR
ncbi:MAG: hypothetical protein Q7T16_02970 [Candidatus Burarchaeum sp.]|nr:hypothetical protein [Candidatus Burarchaeum sp.]MDO8339597.1 hypothetical protein [Candidatus Burarchaeum sp.]